MLFNIITSKIKKNISHTKNLNFLMIYFQNPIRLPKKHLYIYIYILEFRKNELDIKVRNNFIDNPKSCFTSVGT